MDEADITKVKQAECKADITITLCYSIYREFHGRRIEIRRQCRYLVQLPALSETGKWIALPGLKHGDSIISMIHAPESKICYIPERGQYEIFLNKQLKEPLQYIAVENETGKEEIFPCEQTLPDSLRKILDDAFGKEKKSDEKKYPAFLQLKQKIAELKNPENIADLVLEDFRKKIAFSKNIFDFKEI